MPTNKEKHLLVVSFLEGKNFIRRNKVKFIVEAKFDGEHLATDPVDHAETIEINQELAWELDKKSLHMHRLQRSAIKAVCYAVSDSLKESIGYVVLDIRSAPEGIGKPKWYNLLQPKYPKLKPSIQINLYVEDDQPVQLQNPPETEVSVHKKLPLENNSFSASFDNKQLNVNLIESEGYFQIEKSTPQCSTYVLTITIAFAKNLIRLITDRNSPSTHFYFVYKFLNNQVSTKPFEDIVSCQINGERSAIRLHTTYENLNRFLRNENNLEITFCSNECSIGHCLLNWKTLLDKWTKSLNSENVIVDYLLKFEAIDQQNTITGRNQSPMIDINTSPVIGVQIGLSREDKNSKSTEEQNVTSTKERDESPAQSSSSDNVSSTTNVQSQIVIHDNKEMVTVKVNNEPESTNQEPTSYMTQEMQLKAAYEIEMWKEAREKEFEFYLKKLEAKKFQALAEAFKQHDIERETLVQKKMKEYSELEVVLKNSLAEVEKREKQLAFNESQVTRLKADLHHEYENKLLELREASKRVQEKADHQIQLQKSRCDSFEEEISRLKRQLVEQERKTSDKETEFMRYKERENGRPEVRLQSELNMLNLEKLELERKLDTMLKAKNHYKEQWSKALLEIGNIKKKEEACAKAALKKQQMELEHLRLRYLAAEENELIKTDEKQLQSLKSELEKLKVNTNHSQSEESKSSYNLNNCLDQDLKDHINRLTEERDTLLRTGVYSNTDGIIVELDKRIRDCYKQAK